LFLFFLFVLSELQEVIGLEAEELVIGAVLLVNGVDLGLGQLSEEVLDQFRLAGHVRELDGGPVLAVLVVVHHLDQNL